MRKYIWTITLASLALSGAAAAAADTRQAASREETIGVGAGGVVGAFIGGPVGFIVGAAIGAKLGDTMHEKDDRIDELTASLDDSRSQIGVLEDDVQALSAEFDAVAAELERLQRVSRPELASLLQSGIELDLLFRTDEHVLTDATGARLFQLAETLATMPDIRLQLDGFADERGAEEYNLALSEKRVEFVREQFLAAGVDPTRIVSAAHGESPAQDDSVDSYALERRVALKLTIDDSPSFASNPD